MDYISLALDQNVNENGRAGELHSPYIYFSEGSNS
jgi:hypothetical protein